MKPFRVLQIAFFVARPLAFGSAAWAKFGISKTRVTFPMHHPPVFFSPAREVRIDVTASNLDGIPMSNDLQGMLGRALLQEGFKPVPAAQTIIGITIREAESRVAQQRRVESVNVHTGTHTETDKKGKSKEVEDCQVKDSRVTYLISTARLALTLEATDSNSQALLASENIERTYQMESAVSGPQQCGGKEYHLKEDQIADSYAVLHGLAGQAIPRIVQLTAGYDEERTVLLAVDDELKPGNAEALAGNWQAAFDTWTQAGITKQDTEAARQYNLGVAEEVLGALAMRSGSLDDATRHLTDAEACYRKALQLDADEKYFRDTLARLQNDREILQANQEHEFLKQASDAARAPSATTASNQPSLGFPIDGWPDGEPQETHNFRAYVRQRMVVRGLGKLDDDFRQKLVADGSDYQVKHAVATQVVESEANRLLIANQNVLKYQDLVRDLASDGVMTKDERAILETRRKTLHLSVAEARQAESQFQFREE